MLPAAPAAPGTRIALQTPMRITPDAAQTPSAAAGRSPSSGHHLLDTSSLWPPSGAGSMQRVLGCKHDWLEAQGWRHTLLAPRAHGHGRIDSGGLRLPWGGGWHVALDRRRAARLIEAAQPDIVESADPFVMGWAALDAAARLQIPAVACCHANLPALVAQRVAAAGDLSTGRGRWALRQLRRYVARLYQRHDLVLAPSASMTRKLHEWGVKQAVHQPLGVDCSVFSPKASDATWRHVLERRLELAPGTRLLVYAGSFGAHKNLALLAEAVDRLGAGHALLAVGAGAHPPTGPRTRVLPPQPSAARLARLLASCDVFVHAGEHEAFGLAALEAMACGTPVVVSDAGGLGELAAGAGIVVRSREPQAWCDAITASLTDLGPSLAWVGLERARAHDWSIVFGQLTRRYLQAMHARRQRQPGTPFAPTADPGQWSAG